MVPFVQDYDTNHSRMDKLERFEKDLNVKIYKSGIATWPNLDKLERFEKVFNKKKYKSGIATWPNLRFIYTGDVGQRFRRAMRFQ